MSYLCVQSITLAQVFAVSPPFFGRIFFSGGERQASPFSSFLAFYFCPFLDFSQLTFVAGGGHVASKGVGKPLCPQPPFAFFPIPLRGLYTPKSLGMEVFRRLSVAGVRACCLAFPPPFDGWRGIGECSCLLLCKWCVPCLPIQKNVYHLYLFIPLFHGNILSADFYAPDHSFWSNNFYFRAALKGLQNSFWPFPAWFLVLNPFDTTYFTRQPSSRSPLVVLLSFSVHFVPLMFSS